MNYYARDIVYKNNGFEINSNIYLGKNIKEVKILNIEAQFINDKNSDKHLVLDQYTQTGIFTTPKFYLAISVKINSQKVLIIVSKSPVYFGSDQYYSDKKESEEIKSKLVGLMNV